jgi:hypothetical protein
MPISDKARKIDSGNRAGAVKVSGSSGLWFDDGDL